MSATIFIPPSGTSFSLIRARTPAALVDGLPGGASVDDEGLALLDIAVRDGVITALSPPGAASSLPVCDLDSGQVWPAFVDLHTHLDKGHIWPRAGNKSGTHFEAVTSVAADRRMRWNERDVAARFAFALRCAYAHGTAAIRTHIDSHEPEVFETSWTVFRDLRAAWSGRIELQAVAMVAPEIYAQPDGVRIADAVARSGGLLGGTTRIRQPLGKGDDAELDLCLDRMFALAAERGLDVDLHVDETLDPSARTLAQVARSALRQKFTHSITCGHCCSLTMQPEAEAAETMALCRDANISIVSLPMVNLYLQGRATAATPRWRGITLVHELRDSGIAVAVASDNCRDPFFGFGDHDMVEVFREFVRIAHADAPYGDWVGAVTAVPAKIMGLRGHGVIRVGGAADLVLFRGRGMSELLSRPQSDRIVLRAGRAIDPVLPDYRELDDAIMR